MDERPPNSLGRDRFYNEETGPWSWSWRKHWAYAQRPKMHASTETAGMSCPTVGPPHWTTPEDACFDRDSRYELRIATYKKLKGWATAPTARACSNARARSGMRTNQNLHCTLPSQVAYKSRVPSPIASTSLEEDGASNWNISKRIQYQVVYKIIISCCNWETKMSRAYNICVLFTDFSSGIR